MDRSTKISEKDKEIIWRFIDLLKALRVSKGRLAKYIFHLKVMGENLGLPFESVVGRTLNTSSRAGSTSRDTAQRSLLITSWC
ncbi:MAG: hypothetical protein ACYC7D_12110 [Nitrososphaerales archaeon]